MMSLTGMRRLEPPTNKLYSDPGPDSSLSRNALNTSTNSASVSRPVLVL